MIIETERLYLREMTEADYPDLCEMIQDEETMYAYNGAMSDRESREWLERQLARYERYGFGFWAVCLKETDEMVGQCGLTMQPWQDTEVLEIGYLLKKKYWHRGYATEAAVACKKYAFENLNRAKVYSIIKSDNLASMKIAESIGMIKEDEFITQYYNGEMLHFLYSVHAGTFSRS